MTARPIAAPIRRTAGCFLNPLYIDVEKLPEFQPGAFAESDDTIVRCGGAISSIMPPSPN